MNNIGNKQVQSTSPCQSEMVLTPLEQFAAWGVIDNNKNVMKMGKYFYIGMKYPAAMPEYWWEVDCHLLGFLTERKCRLLSEQSKDFIEYFILGERYKEYRRSLKKQTVL